MNTYPLIFFFAFVLILCILCLIILYCKLDVIHKSHESLIREHQQLSDLNNLLHATVDSVKQQGNDDKALLQSSVASLEEELTNAQSAHKTLLSQKKSSEVRLGNIAEKLAPFLDHFTFDPECATFLGQPIDYVIFEDEVVTFLEIKSGKSQLSSKQRHIRDLIKNKQVAWKEIRIK